MVTEYIPWSHIMPWYPGAHKQRYVSAISSQVAPLLHGLESQSKKSEGRRKTKSFENMLKLTSCLICVQVILDNNRLLIL